MLAIWQILNPTEYFASGDPNLTRDLEPFKDGTGKFYTSETARDYISLRYDYDLLQRNPPTETDAERVARVKAFIASTYNHTGAVLTSPQAQDFLLAAPEEEVAPAPPPPELAEQPVLQQPIAAAKNTQFPDYILNILYDRHVTRVSKCSLLTSIRYALEGAQYSIHFFMGDVPDDELASRTSMISRHPRHISSMYTFSSAAATRECANCQDQKARKALETAQLPLTVHLLRRAADTNDHDIHHIDHRSAERYLEKHLTWKAFDVRPTLFSYAVLSR